MEPTQVWSLSHLQNRTGRQVGIHIQLHPQQRKRHHDVLGLRQKRMFKSTGLHQLLQPSQRRRRRHRLIAPNFKTTCGHLLQKLLGKKQPQQQGKCARMCICSNFFYRFKMRTRRRLSHITQCCRPGGKWGVHPPTEFAISQVSLCAQKIEEKRNDK